MVDLNMLVIEERDDEISDHWPRLGNIIDKAEELGEFDFEKLEGLIEVFGEFAGQDQTFNAIVERLAKAVGARKGEAEEGLLLLKRAKQLDFEQKFEIIRLLGKAARSLTKKEYANSLIDALQLLSLAYKSAGLFWAARASCIFALASIVIEDEDISQLRPASFQPCRFGLGCRST